MTLAEKLVSLRKSKGLSQLKLAEMMHVSRQAISRWEGGAAVPSTDNLKYLGLLYNVPVDYLLQDDAPEPCAYLSDVISSNNNNTTKKPLHRNRLIIIALIVLIAGIVTFIYAKQKSDEIVSIESLENDENWENSAVTEFSLDW